MRRRGLARGIGIMAVIAAAMTVAPVAVGAVTSTTVVVQAGAKNPVNPSAPYEYTKFYPRGADGSSTVTVHRNDTVRWEFNGFHSVAFLPGSTATDPHTEHPVWIRRDEIPGTMAANEDWWRASACGHTNEEPCVVNDSSGFLSSGAPVFVRSPFSVRIDRPAGTTLLYHCTVHAFMHGTIKVVSDAAALPTQASLDAQTASEVLQDTAKADALTARKATSRFEGGKRIWNVHVGEETADRTVQVIGYLGRNADGSTPLHIAPDDVVEFEVKGQEPHTVTFPSEVIGDRNLPPLPAPPYGTGGLRGVIRCDLDNAESGFPGIPFSPAATTGCPAGSLEITFNRWVTDPQGSSTILLHGQYADSAFMVAPDNAMFMRSRPGDPSTWPSTYTATFPVAGTFTYGCNLHFPFMVSSIEVR